MVSCTGSSAVLWKPGRTARHSHRFAGRQNGQFSDSVDYVSKYCYVLYLLYILVILHVD